MARHRYRPRQSQMVGLTRAQLSGIAREAQLSGIAREAQRHGDGVARGEERAERALDMGEDDQKRRAPPTSRDQ